MLIILLCFFASVLIALPTDPFLTFSPSRTATLNYIVAKRAASDDNVRLNINEWHYFRICHLLQEPAENEIQKETGCVHHMLLVGPIRILDRKWHFRGTFYHAQWSKNTTWTWNDDTWSPRPDTQKLYYGGRTSSFLASTSRLGHLSNNWIAGNKCRDLGSSNCLGYYTYMAQRIDKRKME